MAHPSHYWIKFMVLQGWPDETVETVNTTLKTFGFPEISEEEFTAIKDCIKVPPNFYFNSKTHEPTISLLKEEKVYSLWAEQKEDMEAVDLINYPQIRETVQLLLLGRHTGSEIKERIKSKYDRDISELAIESFEHYFWNGDLVGSAELLVLLRKHPMQDAYLASMNGSKNQSLFRAGFSPQIDGRKALREAHRNLAMRIEATRFMPDSVNTSRILTSLTKELVITHTALYGDGAGLEDMMKDLQKFVMERNAPNVVPITKIAPKGNFSNSGGAKAQNEDN